MSFPDAPEAADFLAIEVGSSRIKLGKFAAARGCTSDRPEQMLPIAAQPLAEPLESLALPHGRDLSGTAENELSSWIAEHFISEPQSCFAAVQPNVAAQLVEFFAAMGWQAPRQLTWRDMPLEVRVDEVAQAGIDRLLTAVAANLLRDPQRPAIVVDLGTAGTVNLVSADGAFEGGAILPGMALAASALHAGTSNLPQLDPTTLEESVSPLGKNTDAAIAAGVYWGVVGAIRELVAQLADQCPQAPQLFVTGGAAPQVVRHLALSGEPARHLPHLVLSAIRLVAEQLR